jgi:hypothetical protein
MAGPRRLDLSDPGTLRRVWDLPRAAYAVEAELIGFDGIPPLRESLQELLDCGESFLGLDGDWLRRMAVTGCHSPASSA